MSIQLTFWNSRMGWYGECCFWNQEENIRKWPKCSLEMLHTETWEGHCPNKKHQATQGQCLAQKLHTSQALLQPHLRFNQDINQPVRWDVQVSWWMNRQRILDCFKYQCDYVYIYIHDFYGYIKHSWHPAHQISACWFFMMVSIMSFKTAPEDDPEFSGLWHGMSQLSSP